MKITKNELKEIIREEAIKFKRKIELENELSEVQSQLDEVTGGPGTHVANDTAGVMYDKNEKTKGGALVEDGESCEEEVVAEDGIEINVGDDDVPQESYLSEEALEEMLSEIMSEDDDDDGHTDDGHTDDGHTDDVDDVEPVEEEVVAEKEACEEEVVAESKEEEKEVISEEVKRMRELAGIKIL